MSMKKRVEVWAYSLVSGAIGGGATALFSWMGMAGAHQIGIDVPVLNFKAMGVIFLSGMLPPILAYLKQSPLPPMSDGQTEFVKKSDAPSTETKTEPPKA